MDSTLIAHIQKRICTTVDKWINKMHQIIHLEQGYVSDQLKTPFLLWYIMRAIILNLPTGAGKTYFILHVLIPYAIAKGKRVLIVSNRISLDAALKKEIAELFGLYEGYPDNLLRKADDFGLVTVTTYQKLFKYIYDKEFCKDIAYAVFDECHYFTSDSTFSKNTDNLLYKITIAFSRAVRIFISATIDEVLPYICDAEMYKGAITRWHSRYYTDKSYRDWINRNTDSFYRQYNPEVTKMLIQDSMYALDYPMPITYKADADYSKTTIKFYESQKIIKETIDKSDDKSIVFVDNKKFGSELHKDLESSVYMNAEINSKDSATLQKIVTDESFAEKVLITTGVFCNGCNICDKNVKNMFVECLGQTDIIQMAGRKRKQSTDDTVTLYLKIPDVILLESLIKRIQETLDTIYSAKNDTDKYLNMILNDSFYAKRVSNLCYVDNCKLYFNEIGIDMLRKQKEYYSDLIKLISEKGPTAYCKMISKKLFNKEFSEEMIVKPVDYIKEITDLLIPFENHSFDKATFDELSNSIVEIIKQLDPSAKERSDRILGVDALNRRLEKYDIQYKFVNEGNEYWIISTTVNSQSH